MAIVVRTAIGPADQEAYNRLDESVETASRVRVARRMVYPSGYGFLIVDVRNSEDAFRAWWTDVMDPTLAEVDLTVGEHEVNPVWSLARPYRATT